MNVNGVTPNPYTLQNPLQQRVSTVPLATQVSKPSDGDGDHGMEPHKGQHMNAKA